MSVGLKPRQQLIPHTELAVLVEPVKALALKTATEQAAFVQGLISLHECVWDLHARALFRTLENLAMDQ